MWRRIMVSNATPAPQPTPAPSPTVPSTPQQPIDYLAMPKGGFLYRFIAWLIDAIILGIIQSVITVIIGAPIFLSGVTLSPGAMAAQYSTMSVISLVVGILYFVYFWGDKGATPGKMALGLKIVGTDGTMPIGYPKAFVRYIGYIISSIICLLGYLLIIIDDDNQGLHDKIASTFVVKVS